MKKNIVIYLIIFIIGFSLGTFIIYNKLKENEEIKIESNNTLQASIKEEAKKLLLRNSMYNYVDSIEDGISVLLTNVPEYIIKAGDYILINSNTMHLIDEDGNEILDSTTITDIVFTGNIPNIGSKATVNEKGRITAASFYVDEYVITYDLIGVTVIKKEN